jgi:teichuronic acid biosynthesis glycosyltransferase TuaC
MMSIARCAVRPGRICDDAMRILFLATDFPSPELPTRGPFNLALAKALSRHHDLRVIAPIAWPARLRARPAPFDTPEFSVWRPTYYYPPKILRSAYHHWMTWSIRKAIAAACDGWAPEAVLSYWAHPDGAAGNAIARKFSVPSAVIIGGSDVLLLPKKSCRKDAVTSALTGADAIVTVSRHLKTAVEGLGIDPKKVHVWSQGVDGATFFPGDKAVARKSLGLDPSVPIFLSVARLVPVKGIDILLAAAKNLQDRGARFRLVIVGDGPLRSALENQSQTLGVTQIVTFAGARNGREIAQYYRAADRTILSSHSEGLPNVLRESLACGTRFIATEVGGIREIAGEGDLLVPSNNPAALAEAMHSVLGVSASASPRLPDWDDSAEALVRILSFGKTPLQREARKSA